MDLDSPAANYMWGLQVQIHINMQAGGGASRSYEQFVVTCNFEPDNIRKTPSVDEVSCFPVLAIRQLDEAQRVPQKKQPTSYTCK